MCEDISDYIRSIIIEDLVKLDVAIVESFLTGQGIQYDKKTRTFSLSSDIPWGEVRYD